MSKIPSVLRINVAPFFPMVNPDCMLPTFHENRWCPRPGLAMELIKLIADNLNVTIDTKILSTETYYTEYTDIFNPLINNETDLYSLLFEKTDFRITHEMDFSSPLYESHTKIAVRRKDHSLKSIFDFFTVYNYESWLLMALVFVLFTGFGVFVRYLEWRLSLRDSWNASSLVFKMVRLQLIQPDPIDYKFMSGSTSLIVFTVFQICIIAGIYESWVLSSVIRSKDPFPFRPEDLVQVLKERKYFIVAPNKDDWMFNDIQTSYQSPYYELRDALKDNPIISIPNIEESFKVVMNENAFMIMPNDQMQTFMADKYCDLVYMESPIPPNKERFMFSKGSPFVEPFNRAIEKNAVLIQKLYRKYLVTRPPSNCTKIDSRPVPLKLTPYYGVIILFFIGMSSACFMFSGEIWKYYHKCE